MVHEKYYTECINQEVMFMEWKFRKITDYFDSAERIAELAKIRAELSETEREKADADMREHIVACVRELHKAKIFYAAAASVVDLLYRAVNTFSVFSNDILSYINVAGRTALSAFETYGIRIHYLTNNTFDNWFRPIEIFPAFFQSCGFIYICKHEIVKMLMEADGHRGAKILGKLFSLYEREAAGIRDEVISSCINEGLSYILLEMGGGDEVFESCFAPSKEYDIITAFRTDSPVDSDKFACGVAMRESANR